MALQLGAITSDIVMRTRWCMGEHLLLLWGRLILREHGTATCPCVIYSTCVLRPSPRVAGESCRGGVSPAHSQAIISYEVFS
jgi:hypothetical protein